MWIHDEIWHNALSRKGKIFLPVGHATGTLLSMTRGKLISDLGNFDRSHLDLYEKVISGIVMSQHDLVDHALLRVSQSLGSVSFERLGRSI